MLIHHLLAADPTTQPATLAWLGSQHLTAPDALTLATRPDYPTDAPLTVTPPTPLELAAALTHPDLPAHHRQAFITATATRPNKLTDTIGNHDCFTADELTTIYNTSERDLALTFAVARNTHTPAPLAATVVAALTAHMTDRTRAYGTLPLHTDALALTHHLPPVTPAAHAAATTPDPIGTYAEHLAHTGRTQHATDIHWWDHALTAVPHPTLIAAALAHVAANPGARARSIVETIARNHRIPATTRHAAARTIHAPTIDGLAATADPNDLHPDTDRSEATAHAIAWDNPNVTAHNLRELYNACRPQDPDDDKFIEAIGLHPHTPHDLRTLTTHHPRTRTTHYRTQTHPLITALTTTHAHHTTTAAADIPWHHLNDTGPNAQHLTHWAHQAWTHTPHPAITPEYAQALIALDRNHFTGTLRELLTTAAAITTRT